MLTKIGTIIEKRPGLIVVIILLITIGFGTLLPSLEMKTSMEDFFPDDEVVNAEQRVNDYFGGSQEILMVYVEKQKAENAITPDALKEEYFVVKELEKIDKVDGSVSVADFVDIICGMEFGKSLLDCSDDEINTAFQDLMEENKNDEIKMMFIDDPDEQNDFDLFPRISDGKTENSMDIKNYYIKVDNKNITFTIEVYDLSHFESTLKPSLHSVNVIEWYMDFKNLIIPDEQMNIDFKIAAHLEPTNTLWEIGNGPLKNLKDIFQNLRNHELFKSYTKEVFLWMKPPGQTTYFPMPLESANIMFNTNENRIDIEVPRVDLGRFGIAPKMGTMELPARLGNLKAGIRYFQIPYLKTPWSRVSINMGFTQKSLESIQNKPLMNNIFTKILSKSGDFSWQDLDMLFTMFDEDDALSLKDFNSWWIVADEAPDTGFSENTLLIKPFFMEELKTSIQMFLSDDYTRNSGPSATLMMILINGSSSSIMSAMNSDDVSANIVHVMEESDKERDYVKMSATGNGVISYQINEITEEANIVIMPAIFIVISLILFITFRKISYIILPLVGLTISIIWLFGTMVLLDMSFNTMMVALVPLLMGLGVDYSVHMFHNYRAELQNGKSYGEAIIASIQDVGMAMFLATITTVIAFLSFLTASLPPLRDFGILCAIGIGYTFFITITLQAAVRYSLDKRKNMVIKPNHKRYSLKTVMIKTSNIVCRHPKTILLAASVVTLVMVGGALNIQSGFSMEDFLPEDNPALETMGNISEKFPFASQEQEYILIEGDVASVEVLRGISRTHENLRDDKFVSETPNKNPKASSIWSIIQRAIRENSTIASKFNIGKNGFPDSDRDVKHLYNYLYESDSYGLAVKEVLHLHERSYDATVIRVYTDISSFENGAEDMNKDIGILYSELQEDIPGYGNTKAIVTGQAILIYTITSSLTESQVISTMISVILAALVLIIAYRKPLLGLITMIPVSISVIWIIGTMYFIGYSLNVMTVMVTSLTIGLGITYAIHAVERFRLTADKTGDVMKAVSETVGHTGGALMVAAITTIAGFGMLVLAPIPPEQQFGLITAMTILYSFLTTIFILPPFLMFWGRWQKKRKGYIISPGINK
ncbi:MAG: hypothetical protein DRN27_09085 [Thermoplasmata archaeon]|nr:MAG: hypothetical protein DRN27_09085 [Thermoplasmata archaeon]